MAAATSGVVIEEKSTGADGGVVGRNPAGNKRGRRHHIEFWPNLPQNSQPAQIAEVPI